MLLGGVLYRDQDRSMSADLPRAMAARLTGSGTPVGLTSGPFGVFTAGASVAPQSAGLVLLAAELDLVNLAELGVVTGCASPAAIVAKLYELEGPEGVQRLRGGFALALWDSRRQELLLAVDHLGIRRLYYTRTAEGILFASRPAALLGGPGVAREAEPTALYHYLNFGFVPSPQSIFAGIVRLPAGCMLLARHEAVRSVRYWDLAYSERPLALAETSTRTARLAEAAVARALGDFPAKAIGAFLSGGTDSSTVVGLMHRLTGERVNAFSIGFQEARYNELDYANLSARHFDATHYVHIVTPDEALAAVPSLVDVYDEPFGNDSAIGTLLCARLARDCGVQLLLAGDGGDEIFGGNERYATDRIFARYQLLPRLLRRGVLEPMLLHLPVGRLPALGKAQRYVQRAMIPNPRRFYFYEFFFAQDGRVQLAPDFLDTVEPGSPWALIEDHFQRVQTTTDLNRLLYLDMKFTIADNDLLKVTRTAEMAGVAVAFPFLDLPLVEFTTTWPEHFKVRGLEKRYLFKRAFRSLLPAATLAKQKHGFGVPTSLWLRTHPGFAALAHDALQSSDTRVAGYFRPGAIETLFSLHAQDPTPFYGAILWKLLMLELWYRRHLAPGAAA